MPMHCYGLIFTKLIFLNLFMPQRILVKFSLMDQSYWAITTKSNIVTPFDLESCICHQYNHRCNQCITIVNASLSLRKKIIIWSNKYLMHSILCRFCPSRRDTLDYVICSDQFSSTTNIASCFSVVSSEFRHQPNELIYSYLCCRGFTYYFIQVALCKNQDRCVVFSLSCDDALRPGVPMNI
jgi:hypothetical protein